MHIVINNHNIQKRKETAHITEGGRIIRNRTKSQLTNFPQNTNLEPWRNGIIEHLKISL